MKNFLKSIAFEKKVKNKSIFKDGYVNENV